MAGYVSDQEDVRVLLVIMDRGVREVSNTNDHHNPCPAELYVSNFRQKKFLF